MSAEKNTTDNATKPKNFIRHMIDEDIKNNKNNAKVATRFPPEPNGYLHIGHAKSICLNFGIAQDYNGTCNLRFDDTNPAKEEIEFVEAIKTDVKWLGFDWEDRLYFSSNYFEKLHDFAVELISAGKAYVCDLNAEQTREYRGSLTQPGKDSPNRNRSVDENLALFEKMRTGEFENGHCTLRAKIDMASGNINLRDPAIYRIRKGLIHHQTGDAWNIYPMYDFTHCISDAIEGITHSLCTLEFEDHRPLYDWYLDNISIDCHPQQIEFSRLNLEYTVMSKRKLTELVTNNHVHGWDDPRMPTIAGLRRRGFTPASIIDFCDRIGVTKVDNTIEMGVLENCIREDLNENAPRRMAVLDPVKVVLENYDESKVEELQAPNHPQKEEMGTRKVYFSRELYIDRDDFREEANRKYKRLVLGEEVRLRNAYVIRADKVIKNEQGEIIELCCSYDPETLGKNPEGRKVKGVIHWVSASHGIEAEVRVYDRLFTHPTPDSAGEGTNYLDLINPESLKTLTNAYVEASLVSAVAGEGFQFEREGYFCRDLGDNTSSKPVFNRTVTLRDTWAKFEEK